MTPPPPPPLQQWEQVKLEGLLHRATFTTSEAGGEPTFFVQSKQHVIVVHCVFSSICSPHPDWGHTGGAEQAARLPSRTGAYWRLVVSCSRFWPSVHLKQLQPGFLLSNFSNGQMSPPQQRAGAHKALRPDCVRLRLNPHSRAGARSVAPPVCQLRPQPEDSELWVAFHTDSSLKERRARSKDTKDLWPSMASLCFGNKKIY